MAGFAVRDPRSPHVTESQRIAVERDVTFLYKLFNRQRKALRLLRSIRACYPEAKVVIADDSANPLVAEGAEVVRLPFVSGLGRGLEAALARVRTPYVMRLDDLVLTSRTRVRDQLAYLESYPGVDLCGIQMCELHTPRFAAYRASRYETVCVGGGQLVPAGTDMDGRTVVEKSSNCFLARTESVRAVGRDPNIRMIDHHDFFRCAADRLVCVQDPTAYVYHCRNPFDWRYRPYREDFLGDLAYIRGRGAAEVGSTEARTREDAAGRSSARCAGHAPGLTPETEAALSVAYLCGCAVRGEAPLSPVKIVDKVFADFSRLPS